MKNLAYYWIRQCAVCKVYHPPTLWLCSKCNKHLKAQYLPLDYAYRMEKSFPHLRLFDWKDDNDLFVRKLLTSLKNNLGSQDFFKQLAFDLFSKSLHFNLWAKNQKPIFIPAPRYDLSQPDHAEHLSHALNFYYQSKVITTLKKKSSPQKKSRKRFQRSRIQVSTHDFFDKDEVLVFVDDVLTTGATARASYQALNCPKHFFVLTLAWRKVASRNQLDEKALLDL